MVPVGAARFSAKDSVAVGHRFDGLLPGDFVAMDHVRE